MDVREQKWWNLNRAQRQAQRAAGDAWWQKSAREARQSGRRDFWGRWIEDADPGAQMPTGVGRNLPGPGDPGSRTTGSRGAPAFDWTNPLFLTVAGAAAWMLFANKKKK